MVVAGEITPPTSVGVRKRDRGPGGSNNPKPAQNFFYDKPAQGPQQGYHVHSYPSPWYPQPSGNSSPQPPSQGSGPSNISSHYYMGMHPVPPNSPRRPVYPPPGTSQDARYGVMPPVVLKPRESCHKTSHPPNHQSINIIIHEDEETAVAIF